MRRSVVLLAGMLALTWRSCATDAAEFIWVEKGVCRAPIVVPEDAAPGTVEAAQSLADYLEKISGARPVILTGMPTPRPERAVWVGMQAGIRPLFPGVALDFVHPEEILLACNGRHLLVAGRDRMVGANQTEYGTANAVFTFLQDRLGVRWFWPGPLGEDIVPQDTIASKPFEYRFHPRFRQRNMRWNLPAEKRAGATVWWNFQRTRGSLGMSAGHAFVDWWEKYHRAHPEYFALRGDGTRTPDPKGGPTTVKLCVSSPGVSTQWLENAVQQLAADPSRIMVSASPNDSGGWCACDACRAWDHPAGEPMSLYGKPHVVLTDRYVKFWNILARGLRTHLPEREVFVGAWAYASYRTPPVAEVLDKRVAIGFVGNFPLENEALRQKEKAMFQAWAGKAQTLIFRPNLFWYSGGALGMPSISRRKTIEDFRFLAENHCVGIDVDSHLDHWATQGVQFYLMAQLMYDPLRDGNALLEDYYRRAFGAAAGGIEQYMALMDDAHDRLTELPGWRPSTSLRFQVVANCLQIYTPELLGQAETIMASATADVARGPEIHRQRVAFVHTGLEFTRLQLEIMRAMAEVRQSAGKTAGAVKRAVELCDARERLLQRHHDTFALNGNGLRSYAKNRAMEDYVGPPSSAFRAAAGIR